jgi:transmembrane sensor
MQNDPAHIRNLLINFINNQLSPLELEELFEYIKKDPETYGQLMDEAEIKKLLRTKASEGQGEKFDVSAQVSNRMRERLMSEINSEDNVAEMGIDAAPEYQAPVQTIKPGTNIIRFRRVAAAAIILVLFSGTWIYFNKNKQPTGIARSLPIPPNDIKAPKTNRATITLSGGKSIFLDSAANGQLALQNNVKLIKSAGGTIFYDVSSPIISTALIYNTLTNPRGSKPIAITLTDGTKVWLNAASSLRYPVAFNSNERNVEISGEAYFEVSHNPSKPFVIKKLNNDTKVTVLGTHFNVNAYDDEASIKVTLLEGSVKVSKGNNNTIIKPGQQAIINGLETNISEIKVKSGVDTDEVMAWTTGFFQFDQLDIQSIMRQVARWYDLDITYETQLKSDRFGGRLSKDLPLSDILKSLEANGNGVKFRLEGKKLFVQ